MKMVVRLGIILLVFCLILTQSSVSLSTQSTDNANSLPIPSNLDPLLSQINESLMKKYLVPLVEFGPRVTGTEGCARAATFIYEKFERFGLETRFQPWTSFGNRYNPRFFNCKNVIGILPGLHTEKSIIFGAHYDSVAVSPGANDDGSGVAGVLAAADILSKYQFNHTIIFIAFSGEEEGLLGSWAYATQAFEQNDQILLDINADMIGYAVTGEGGRKMGFSITEDADWAVDIIETVSDRNGLGFSFNRYPIDRQGRGWSDYFPFVAYGHEAVACWEGDHDPNMHTPNDTIDIINYSYLVNTTRIITGTLAEIANYSPIPPQIRITSPERKHLYVHGMKKGTHDQLHAIIINDIWIWADDPFGSIQPSYVEFSYDDHIAYIDTSPPFKWKLDTRSFGKHEITVKSYNYLGQHSTDMLEIIYINPAIQ